MRPHLVSVIAVSLVLFSQAAMPQQAQVLRDLDALNAKKLSREELQQLMPGAKMSRLAASGNTHVWTNEPDGTFIVSSDNRNLPGGGNVMGTRGSSSAGKWHISDDGRYCVLIEWKSVKSEEWCRYFFQTSDSYYAAKTDQDQTEKVFKFQIGK
jgi:uncharacterized protein DUF995